MTLSPRCGAAMLCLVALFAGPASGQPAPPDPDWPCIQRLVPELSPGQIWAGPALDDAGDWRQDREVAALVARVTLRTTKIEDAEAEIDAFAAGLGDDRAARLTLLFKGAFETINRARDRTIAAAKQFGRVQREMLTAIAQQVAELDAARAADPPDPMKVEALTADVFWSRRIFDDRRRSTTAVCDQPILLEQRLGALAREIGGAISPE